jgi:hypothetical protein
MRKSSRCGAWLGRLLCALVLIAAAPALAEKRVALVIGNAAYKHAPGLANPKNDAEAVAAALKRLKFEVIFGTDLDKSGMERLLRRFSDAIEKADVAVAFYAGHGVQVNGRNYLVPIDARLEKENDLRFEAVPLDDVQSLMETSQRVNILILDACRDNPLARNLARAMGTRSTSIGRGLGETKAGIGTLVVYATQPGNVALDGDGRNSPFTTALMKYIESPGLEIRQVLTRVRNDVITATRDRQVPWDSSSLRGDFFFAAAPAGRETPAPAAPQPAPPAADPEVVFWQSIKDSRRAADFRAYLERWPNGIFARLAAARLGEIERADAERARAEEEARRRASDEARRREADERARADAEGRLRNQALVAELIRKGQNREAMGDFCRRANWPPMRTSEGIGDVGPGGGTVVYRIVGHGAESCSFKRIGPEFRSNGMRYRQTLEHWTCSTTGGCYKYAGYTYCATATGWEVDFAGDGRICAK